MQAKQFLLVLFTLMHFGTKAQEYQFIEPAHYLCNYINGELNIDGEIDEAEWKLAPWTDFFVDIESRDVKKPYYNTRAKMLWNDTYVYFAFHLEEEHIWADIKERDQVIFHNNDIEIFIDANGDTHNYLELELNALNTVWDLYLAKPYRERGPVINEFDFKGLITAVKINGTLNNPKDIDKSWTVEVAIPWKNIISTNTPKRVPSHGESMRINFSRVQWYHDIKNGVYGKKKDPKTGRNLPENNWVWSPMGVIDMHRPELWGIVSFVKNHEDNSAEGYYNRDVEDLRQTIAFIYKKQWAFHRKHNKYAADFKELGIDKNIVTKYNISMYVNTNSFEITGMDGKSGVSYMSNSEGRLRQLK